MQKRIDGEEARAAGEVRPAHRLGKDYLRECIAAFEREMVRRAPPRLLTSVKIVSHAFAMISDKRIANVFRPEGAPVYLKHPSKALNQAFLQKPYQGVPPENAMYLFVGLDANYSPIVEQSKIFPSLLSYLEDGSRFWRTHGIHHPFLLPEYGRGDGWKYHSTFSKIGFRPEHAELVSFAELLHVPTFGRSQLIAEDLSVEHLSHLNDAILHGDALHIFIPGSVARHMQESGAFKWMPRVPEDGQGLKIWKRIGAKTIYAHYHFSVYGKFEQEKRRQLQAIGALLEHTSAAANAFSSVASQ